MMSTLIFCDTCGAANQPQAIYCHSCGQLLQTAKSANYNSITGRLLTNAILKQRYRIIIPVGKGGMGAVYKAEDILLGNRQVAIKEMSQSGLHPQEQKEAADIFRQEALMLARLQHPNLPSIFDHFEEYGRWYLVMSFLEGETLDDYFGHIQTGRLPLDEVLQIGIQLCTVLSYLHSQQPAIIFRDLKPANIMCMSDGHIYLIDFGIARHFKPGKAKDTAYYGSMGYAPPEQYGKAQTTPRSDMYSLGATLHQLLSGHDPSSSPFRFPLLHSLVPTVPTRLATLISQMLEIDEEKRPVTMLLVKQELQTLASPVPQNPVISSSGTSPQQVATISRKLLYTYQKHSMCVNAVAWSPDGTRIASAGRDRIVHVWEAATGHDLLVFNRHTEEVNALAWSPDGRQIASAGKDRAIWIWETTPNGQVVRYQVFSAPITAVTWSPNGAQIAAASADGTVQVWDTAIGRQFLFYNLHTAGVNALTWSPDGTRVASASKDRTVQVWEAIPHGKVVVYAGHKDSIQSVGWSPDGTRIASAGRDRIVHVWEAATGHDLLVFNRHTEEVNALAWSPDGRQIASAGKDRAIWIWETTPNGQVVRYQVFSAPITAVTWSPNGAQIAAASTDGTVQVWQCDQ